MEEPTRPSLHHRLITYIADHLNDLMPARSVANVEEPIVLSDSPTERIPDVHVAKETRQKGSKGAAARSGAVLKADPSVEVEFEPEKVRETFIEIHRGKKNGTRSLTCRHAFPEFRFPRHMTTLTSSST